MRMCRTSEYIQLRLLSFFINQTQNLLKLFGNCSVLKCCKRFKRDLRLFDLPRSSRPPTLERRHFDFIEKLEQNDELILMSFFTYIFTCLRLQFVN